jgi:hypothetical protein
MSPVIDPGMYGPVRHQIKGSPAPAEEGGACPDVSLSNTMSNRGRFSALLGIVGCVSALWGCQGVERLRQDCAKGNVASCDKACEKGVFGEGGCFQAGQAHQRKAGLDFQSPAYETAKARFRKACDGGFGDGCLFAAQMIEAPHSSSVLDDAAKLPAPIGDDELARRQELLVLACDRGSKDGCRRLGDVSIGKNEALARKGYLAACDREVDRDACKAARTNEIQAFERYRSGCKRQSADDCGALGNLVYRIDLPRAVRLFRAEAELRGVAPAVGGANAFVALRAKEARSASVVDPALPRTVPTAPDGLEKRLHVTSVDVKGRVPKTTIERVIRRDLIGPIASCVAMDRDQAKKGSAFAVESTVDLTGDVWRASVSSHLPARVAHCIEAVFTGAHYETPLSQLATVRASFTVDGAE